MFDDIIKSIKADLYDRVSSPLIGSFVISWSIWNYKFLLLIFSDLEVTKKFEIIENDFTNQFWPDVAMFSIVFPLLTSSAYLFIYPFISKPIFKFVKTKQNEILNIDKKLKDERLLSVEESRKIRAQLSILQSEYNQELAEKEKENESLKEEIKRLNKSPQTEPEKNSDEINEDKPKRKIQEDYSEEGINKILTLFAGESDEIAYYEIIRELGDEMMEIEVKYLVDKLLEIGLLRVQSRGPTDYLFLTANGREYIIKNQLHIPFN